MIMEDHGRSEEIVGRSYLGEAREGVGGVAEGFGGAALEVEEGDERRDACRERHGGQGYLGGFPEVSRVASKVHRRPIGGPSECHRKAIKWLLGWTIVSSEIVSSEIVSSEDGGTHR